MHELSIAMSILDVVEEEMQQHQGAQVEAIHVRVGLRARPRANPVCAHAPDFRGRPGGCVL